MAVYLAERFNYRGPFDPKLWRDLSNHYSYYLLLYTTQMPSQQKRLEDILKVGLHLKTEEKPRPVKHLKKDGKVIEVQLTGTS